MANATITRLPPTQFPFVWAMRIGSTDRETFASFLEALKDEIPPYDREWNAGIKKWLFTDEHLDAVIGLLRSFRLTYTVEDFTGKTDKEGNRQDSRQDHRQNNRRQVVSKEQAAAELYLLPSAPPEVITAVYRVLAKIHHPDHGGSTEKMQKLNAAVEVLK